MTPRGLGAKDAALYLGVSVSGFHRLRRTGGLPRPLALTPGRLVWLRDHLDAWLDAKAGQGGRSGDILDDLPDA